MAKVDKLKPGQIVWDVARHHMGNTTVSTISVYAVKIIEVRPDDCVIASWNGNTPKAFYRSEAKRWRLKEPITVKTWNGYGARLATREEIKAMKEKTEAR